MDSSSPPDRSVRSGARPAQAVYSVRTPRERALEAIVRIAAARGYNSTSVADVLERAELSEDEFETMFASKEACFLEAYDAVVDVVVAHVTAAYQAAAADPWPDRIIAGLRALVGLMAAEAEVARMTMVEATAIGEDARIRYRAALGRFVHFLEQGREASSRAEELPEETARFAIGGATSIIFSEIRAGRGEELHRILPDLVFAVTMPYLGVEAAEAEMLRVVRTG
jgi:AcrR family transcriptional regulator